MPDYSNRLRLWLGAPVRLWKSSLTLRVVASALLGTFLALGAAGIFLLFRVTNGIVTGAQEAAWTEANEAMTSIEVELRNAGYDYIGGDTLYQVANNVISQGNAAGRYQVSFVTGLSTSVSSSNLDTASIPPEIVQAVATSPTEVHTVPTEVRFRDETMATVPGYVVASTVQGNGSERYPVYFVFSFAQEEQTLGIVHTAIGFASLLILVAMGLVAFLVTHQTLKPIRTARRAAERLANGELTQLMTVKGTDDLAQLAMSMNHMANQLQQRIRQMEKLSRVQQRFVSDVSHELRTPLTTVRMAADVLYDRMGTLPGVEAKSVELLHKELNRFEDLLADLLEVSRFDAGAAVLVPDSVSLVTLAKSEIDALSDFADGSGSSLDLTYSSTCEARVDSRRVARLMRNLLSNAIEHGEGKPIIMSIAENDDVVAFTVRDHGIGFTKEQGRQLFNRFWRADPARTRHMGGTGLGLSISQEDVRLHQGWIHAWGRPGQGAQFRVVLPKNHGGIVTHSPLPLIPLDARGTVGAKKIGATQ